MNMEMLRQLLRNVAEGNTSVENAAQKLMHLSFEDIDYAHIDHHRSLRKGFPEVIFGQGKTAEQIRREIVGKSPVSGNMIMDEIVENLTRPLTPEERKTGTVRQSRGPETFSGTPDDLQRMFMEKRMTDYMPIILPTEEKVANMLKGTSRSPDEVVGKMAAHTAMPGDNNVEVFRRICRLNRFSHPEG